MSQIKIETSKKPCPQCNNQTIIKETFNPETLMCLECGYHRIKHIIYAFTLCKSNTEYFWTGTA